MTDTQCIELGQNLFKRLKERFVELELVSITDSAESREATWVNIVMPEDEDREIAVRELASELSMDILLQHGYHITVSTATDEERRPNGRKASSGQLPT